MKCKRAQEMLADYVNGILETADSRQIQQHIAQCENCRWELKMLKKVLGLIDNVEVEYPSASIWENFIPDLHRRIENEAAMIFMKKQRRRSYLLPGWAATATIALILFVSLAMWNRPEIRSPQIQVADSAETVQNPTVTEDSPETTLVTGVILEALFTEAEAEKLKGLESAIHLETPIFPYYYHDSDDEDLTGIEDSGTDTVLDGEDVIKYLEDEFAESDRDIMIESDDGEFDPI